MGTGERKTEMKRVWNPPEMKARPLAPGVSANIAWGKKLMLSLVILEPNAAVPEHSHPHEQMGMLVSGTMQLVVSGKPSLLSGNEMYLVPGGVPHSAKAGPEGAVALDSFSPPREDYKRGRPASRRAAPKPAIPARARR